MIISIIVLGTFAYLIGACITGAVMQEKHFIRDSEITPFMVFWPFFAGRGLLRFVFKSLPEAARKT